MALSNIASHLLAYLKIYKLTPNVFADKLSGAYPADYSTEQWFLDNLKPEYNINSNASSRLGTKTPLEVRKKQSESKKRFLSNPENRIAVTKRVVEYNKSQEGRERNRQNAIKRLANPDVRKAMSESTSKLMADPDFFKRNREACAKGVRTESARKKNSESRKAQYEDHDFRQRMRELRFCFVYEIECPDGSIFTTKSMNSLISEKGFNSYIIKKLNHGETYKGYKLLSKTPIK